MLIKKLTIENFQAYNGVHEIEFSKGLNLVIGKGGKGKSKLFNAFYWVLFGNIYITDVGWCAVDNLPQSSNGAMQKHEVVNKRALFLAKVGEMVPVSVKLDLEDDKGEFYSIERSLTCVRQDYDEFDSTYAWKIGDGIIRASFETATGTMVKIGYQAEEVIRSLFPTEIRNYIWFQGESLQSLIDFRDKETLKNAVKYISYYPYYEKLSEIITKSQAKIERQETVALRNINNHNTQVKACLGEIQLLRDQIEREENNYDRIKNDIERVKQAIVEDDAKLQGLASFTELVQKYDKCEADIREINLKLDNIENYQRRQLPSIWIMRKTDSLIKQSKALIEKYAEEEFSTPQQKFIDNPGRSKLEEILRDHRCFVCGSDASEGSEAYKYIIQRLEEQDAFFKAQEEYRRNIDASKKFTYFMGKIQDYPDSLLHSLQAIDQQIQESEGQRMDLMSKRKKINEIKEELDKEINEVKKKYGVDPVRQAGTANLLGNNIQASRSNLDILKRNLGISKSTIIQLKSKLEDEHKKLDALGATSGAQTTVAETEWKNISTFLKDICDRVKEQARVELLHKIESRANEYYEACTKHGDGFRGCITIKDDYSVAFDSGINTSHNDRKKVSIINALLSLNQEAMGVYYPFISDAPTSSYDHETTAAYLFGIKDIYQQSIIITKDLDVNRDGYDKLYNDNKVSRIYELVSEHHVPGSSNPEKHEVSTIFNQLK